MLITLAMGCCPGRKGRKKERRKRKVKSTSIGTGAHVVMVMMIFNPKRARVPSEEQVRGKPVKLQEKKKR